MPETHKLHVIEPIVTADSFEYGVHRLSVPGGWIYWAQPAGGAPVSSFVPLPAQTEEVAPAESVELSVSSESTPEPAPVEPPAAA